MPGLTGLCSQFDLTSACAQRSVDHGSAVTSAAGTARAQVRRSASTTSRPSGPSSRCRSAARGQATARRAPPRPGPRLATQPFATRQPSRPAGSPSPPANRACCRCRARSSRPRRGRGLRRRRRQRSGHDRGHAVARSPRRSSPAPAPRQFHREVEHARDTIDDGRPRPRPRSPAVRRLRPARRTNSSKMTACLSAAMPGPLFLDLDAADRRRLAAPSSTRAGRPSPCRSAAHWTAGSAGCGAGRGRIGRHEGAARHHHQFDARRAATGAKAVARDSNSGCRRTVASRA